MEIELLMTQAMDLSLIVNEEDADEDLFIGLVEIIGDLGFAPFVLPVYAIDGGQFMCANHPSALALIHAIESLSEEGLCANQVVVRVCRDQIEADVMALYLPNFADDDDEE